MTFIVTFFSHFTTVTRREMSFALLQLLCLNHSQAFTSTEPPAFKFTSLCVLVREYPWLNGNTSPHNVKKLLQMSHLFKHHKQNKQLYINKWQWLQKEDPTLSRHLAMGIMSEHLAHDIVQYTNDSITPLPLLHKQEHELQGRRGWDAKQSLQSASPAFT